MVELKNTINVAFIQARLESKRYPNKNLKLMCNYPMIDWVLYGVRNSKLLYDGWLIIPDTKESSAIKEMYNNKCNVFTGNHHNVLDRYYSAMLLFEKKYNMKIDNVVRITADCPMLAYYSNIIDEVLSYHILTDCDFTHNRCVDGYPSGVDVEVMKRDLLIESWEKVNLVKKCMDEKFNQYKEHVTLHIKETMINTKRFGNVAAGVGGFRLKWSIDDEESFNRVNDLLKFHILRYGNVLDIEKIRENREILNG